MNNQCDGKEGDDPRYEGSSRPEKDRTWRN